MDCASEDALVALLTRAVGAPPSFYAQRLAQAAPTGSADAGVLHRLPLTLRADLLRDQLEHRPHGTRRFRDAATPVRAGVSGSGGDLLVLTWSATELQRERAAGARLLQRLGVRAAMRVANALPGALATPGALLLGDVIEDIGALDVPLGSIENESAAHQAWELVDRVQPDVMVLEPLSAVRLLAVTPPATRRWWRGIVWLQRGTAPEHRPPVPAAAGFDGWQRTWLAVPEATSFVAHSCPASRFHVDDGVHAEIVDGTLVLTPLGGDALLLRYASGITARMAGASCPCGTGGIVLELI